MFAKLKAWAAEVWQFVKYAMTSEGVKRWMSIAQDLDRKLKDALNREERYKDQAERWQALVEARDKNIAAHEAECRRLHDLARERFQEIERLHERIKGQELTLTVAASNRDMQDRHVAEMAAERDKHMRAASGWQGQCKRMSEVMRALRHVIDVVTDGKHPEQWFAMKLDAVLKSPPGNTSATDPVNAGGAWPDTSEFTDPASPLKSTTKTARYLEPALEELPAPEPEIATIGDVLTQMNQSDINRRRALAEVIFGRNTTGVESAIRGDGDIETVGHSLNGKPPLTCPNCGCGVGSYTTNRETGVSFCEHCQEKPPSPQQLADEARQYQQAAKLWPNGPKG